jgi:hypothetical protein
MYVTGLLAMQRLKILNYSPALPIANPVNYLNIYVIYVSVV